MKYRKIFGNIVLSISAVALFTSCNESQTTDNIETERIVFGDYEHKPLSDIMADSTFLLLHTSDPNLIVGAAAKMIKKGNRYYFIDSKYRNAVAYDTLGRSISRIGNVGKGHLEYLRCHDISVDNQNYVYISDGTNDKYIKYTDSLNAIEEYNADPEGPDIYITDNNNILVGINPWYEGSDGGRMVALLDAKFNKIQTYGDIGTYDENVALGGTGFANSGQYVSYVSKYEIRDDVMLFSPIDGKLVKRLVFDFGNQSVPDEYKSDIENNMKHIENYTRLQDIFSVTEDRIVGRISIDGKIKPFVIDRTDGILYLGNEIEKKEECIAFLGNSFVNLRQIVQEQYPDSVKKHIENNQTVLEFNKIH